MLFIWLTKNNKMLIIFNTTDHLYKQSKPLGIAPVSHGYEYNDEKHFTFWANKFYNSFSQSCG
jgi:hypothetical protein